ncbi:MAG: hypothetical protein IT337_10405 [Thermomicrobiales bacterium]|nr:hypothetical protein [Thermomicrobiales bacterium]
MIAAATFEPGRYLTKVGGSDYLEVKWRLVWLRETHPDAEITTELVSHDGSLAIFRAKVAIPGGGSATGWGSEGPDDFRDYIEKAETKAIGRALAALGFGTQFCPDFDFGAAAGKVVDSPIDITTTRARRQTALPETERPVAQLNQPATQRQIRYVQAIAREAGLSETDLNAEIDKLCGGTVADLSRRDASALIERLQTRRQGSELAS